MQTQFNAGNIVKLDGRPITSEQLSKIAEDTLRNALLAFEAHIEATPSDDLAYRARDALEVFVRERYPDAMPPNY